MSILEKKAEFEEKKIVYESVKLKFLGVDGFDVYNTSTPIIDNGKTYIYGRVERHNEWARSNSKLFEKVSENTYSLVEDSLSYPIEDPFVSVINGEYILGGSYVVYELGEIKSYNCNFYKGRDLKNLHFYTIGPDNMKDIRLVQLKDSKIGVFSRPKDSSVREKYDSFAVVGFAVINDISELSIEVIENARIIDGLFGTDEWGGCNQALLLESGHVAMVGHQCYNRVIGGQDYPVYCNTAYIFDMQNFRIIDKKIIGTRSCYPSGDYKIKQLDDVAFTSGIEIIDDYFVYLYSGLSDCEEGKIKIANPFGIFAK